MTITSFEYEDRQRQWKLDKTALEPLNLLIGLSGVGKTSIVKALRQVQAVGLSAETTGVSGRWTIELASEDRTYCWQAEAITSNGEPSAQDRGTNAHGEDVTRLVYEKIVDGDGHVLVHRDHESFEFEGSKLPKLKATESAISLLNEEASIAPLYRALERIIFSDIGKYEQEIAIDLDYSEYYSSIDSLRQLTNLSILLKAHIAQTDFEKSFHRIRDHYMEIFPNVADVRIDRVAELDPSEFRRLRAKWIGDTKLLHRLLDRRITLAIKETGVDRWIISRHMSSGMLRTFFHLAEVELSPRGTVLVIDEYENSMGINCLPAVTDLFRERQSELQFILTSHHPYVINNIPINSWRLVTRAGSVVRVQSARDIPELSTKSKQDAFTLLINSSVYKGALRLLCSGANRASAAAPKFIGGGHIARVITEESGKTGRVNRDDLSLLISRAQ